MALHPAPKNILVIGLSSGSWVRALTYSNVFEKIDVVEWSNDTKILITSSLNTAQVTKVDLNEEKNIAVVWVPNQHLSLAIGKEGQNARLAAKMTAWKIDIRSIDL